MSGVMSARAKTPARHCPWCGVREDTAALVVDMSLVGWLCRRLHKPGIHKKPTARVICAICGHREGVVPDEIDGRRLIVCRECRDGDVTERETVTPRERVLRALGRSDGLDIVELAQVLGDDDELGRARISKVLARAIGEDLVKYSGSRMDRVYSLTAQGQLFVRR